MILQVSKSCKLYAWEDDRDFCLGKYSECDDLEVPEVRIKVKNGKVVRISRFA